MTPVPWAKRTYQALMPFECELVQYGEPTFSKPGKTVGSTAGDSFLSTRSGSSSVTSSFSVGTRQVSSPVRCATSHLKAATVPSQPLPVYFWPTLQRFHVRFVIGS